MNGILPLYKPKGLTSHDCVLKIRRLLQTKKVGHTGTLDPNVEGVLPICIGEATKIIPFLSGLKKEYIAEIQLGIATTTEDRDGDIIEQTSIVELPKDKEIEEVLHSFTGEISQVPPMYSAIKVKGKRLYEYARENIEVERPVRHVTIYEMEQLHIEHRQNKIGLFKVRVLCSKGTYVRTLCVDIGKNLGYPAHMYSLIRTKSDGIRIEDTITFSEIESIVRNSMIQSRFLPLTTALQHLDTIQVDCSTTQKILQGQKLPICDNRPKTSYFKMMHEDKFLAIYEIHKKNNDMIKPVRVFNLYKRR